MKESFVFVLVLLAPVNTKAQFSGRITYEDSYRSKTPRISGSDFEKFAGTKREFYIQGPFYKTVHNGELKSVMLYRGDENKIYRYNEVPDTIIWMDASRDTLSRISEPTVENSSEVILGLKCKKITVKSKLGTTTYFFSNTYSINPNDFKNHHLEYWDFYTSTAKSVPLKIIFEGEEIGFTSTAVKVESMKLETSVFKIPPGYLKKRF